MARRNGGKSSFDTMDTPYEVQPVPGSAEGPIVYGGVTDVAKNGDMNDPMGVMPYQGGKPQNIGPKEGEG